MGRRVFRLPDVGEGIAQAEVVAWHVAPGEVVAEDQPLVDVMTDKATVEIPSPFAGRVASLEGVAGDVMAVGSVIVVFEVEGPDQDPAEPAVARPEGRPIGAGALERARPDAPPTPVDAPADAAVSSPRPLASPAVRARAHAIGLRLEDVPGSGPSRRISMADLLQYRPPRSGSAGRAKRQGAETIKVIGLRRQIAERMTLSKRHIPHFSYIEEVDVTELEGLRSQLNGARGDRPHLTVLPFLAVALARTLPHFPQINATFDDERGEITRHSPVHIGVATQTPGGLVVPVIRHAEAMDLWTFADEVARLSALARAGRASREELSGSTITVTSLGPLGGVATTPVINRPEVAIVGPNRIVDRPVVRAQTIAIRRVMNLSSSFDHRVVDGWDAAEFVQRVKRLLETPALLFLENA